MVFYMPALQHCFDGENWDNVCIHEVSPVLKRGSWLGWLLIVNVTGKIR